MEKANVVPIHNKNDKQILSNYRPVSLLPVCSKIFERLICNLIYKHISDNNLLSPNQSFVIQSPNQYESRTGDSYINQLFSITCNIFPCFDKGIETRAIFLDISKAFDKVYHKDLIYKLRQYGFTVEFIDSFNQFSEQQKAKSIFKWLTFLLGRH